MLVSRHRPAGTRNARGEAGFTLLEMSIVLIIIGTVLTGGILYLSMTLKQRAGVETQHKLQVLQQMLLDYRLAYNRIPCPADLKLATTDKDFGVEAVATGGTPPTDTGCNFGSGSPQADFNNGNFYEGMVPTKTLGLSDDYAFDGWGRRIDYAVDMNFTKTNAFSSANIPASDTTTRMTIKTASSGGATITQLAAYVLISFGPDGHGAFPRGASATPINENSTNADEKDNCDCDGFANATGLDGEFIQKAPTQNVNDLTDTFDDMVVYATRSDLRSKQE